MADLWLFFQTCVMFLVFNYLCSMLLHRYLFLFFLLFFLHSKYIHWETTNIFVNGDNKFILCICFPFLILRNVVTPEMINTSPTEVCQIELSPPFWTFQFSIIISLQTASIMNQSPYFPDFLPGTHFVFSIFC